MRTQKDLIKYISAFTLGDGSLRKTGKEAIYRFAQREDHKDYVEWQANILSDINPVTIKRRLENDPDRRPQYYFDTKSHPLYTKVYNRMYIDSHKVISEHYLTLIDWEVLAILHMDDGCLVQNYNKQYDRLDYCVVLSTESFSYGDNYLLAKAIKEKTSLAFDVVNQAINGQVRHRLRLSKRQTPTFIDKVAPFMAESFRYKVSLERLAPEKGDDIV